MNEVVLRGRGPNTLSLESMRALIAQLDAVGDAPFMLVGEGDAFSAGLDLDALAPSSGRPVNPTEVLEAIEACARRLYSHPAPTVACVNGHAVAGGCLLVQCCDHRVVGSDARIKIGMTGIALGLTYPPIVLRIFGARLSGNALEQVILGADRVGPARALELGLVDEIADDPRAVSRERLRARAALDRDAYRETKRALREPVVAIEAAEAEAFARSSAKSWDPDRLRRLRGR